MTRRAALAVVVLGLAAHATLAQTVSPPGVEAARPPTERTLQRTPKSSTDERVRYSRDCRQVSDEILAQYRIQQDSVQQQYAKDSAVTGLEPSAKAALLQARDARLSQLQAQGKAAAKKLADECRADNRQTLRSSDNPSDRH
jgi:parvulin-like peptidyl-prolyl isomerase